MMQKIAITGNIATGKSLVGRFLRERGWAVLDCDDAVAKLYLRREIKDLLQEKFQLQVFNKDGSINKKWLSELIFSNQNYRDWLQNLLWPRVLSAVEMWLFAQEKKQARQAFVLVPLLFEAGWQRHFTQVWLVSSSEEAILQRLQLQRRWDLATAKKRLAAQLPQAQKHGLVDLIINNHGTIAQLQEQINSLRVT